MIKLKDISMTAQKRPIKCTFPLFLTMKGNKSMSFAAISQFMLMYSIFFRVALIALTGFFTLWFTSGFIAQKTKKHLQPHVRVLLNKFIWYGGMLMLLFVVLSELGINITALVGAAGVVGVAVGFASQTSISNIISGIFLLIEHPFKVGDLIETGGLMGKVETVDLLAVRLKTPDGQLVRVPNESLIKSAVINKTFYRARRITLVVAVKHGQDIARAIEITQSTLDDLDVVKDEPAVSISFKAVGTQMIELCIQCWVDSRSVVNSTAAVVRALHNRYKTEKFDVLIDVNQFQQSLLEILENRGK